MHGGKSFLRRDDFSLRVDLNTSDAHMLEQILNNTYATHLNCRSWSGFNLFENMSVTIHSHRNVLIKRQLL